MERRYPALRIIGTIYKILGGVAGLITIVVVLALCASSVVGGAALPALGRQVGRDMAFAGLLSGLLGGLLLSAFALIYGGGIALTLYALGEGIYLLLALEENTRATVMLLQQQTGQRS